MCAAKAKVPSAKAKSAKQEKTVFGPRRSESRPLFALCLAFLAGLLTVALWDYDSQQKFFFQESLLQSLAQSTNLNDRNAMGVPGATVAVLLFNLAGVGAFFVPAMLFISAWFALFFRAHTLFPWKTIFMVVGFFVFVTLLEMGFGGSGENAGSVISILGDVSAYSPAGAGGALGNFLYHDIALPMLGPVGAPIILLIVYAFCLLGIFVSDPKKCVVDQIQKVRDLWINWHEARRAKAEARREMKARQLAAFAEARKKLEAEKRKSAAMRAGDAVTAKTPTIVPEPDETPELLDADETAEALDAVNFAEDPEESDAEIPADDGDDFDAGAIDDLGAISPAVGEPKKSARDKEKPAAAGELHIVAEEKTERAAGTLEPKRKGGYQIPAVTLLKEPPPPDDGPKENYQERADKLITTLGEFKIKVELVEIQTGPVITRYEVSPAPGVRVEKISGLANNLAMNLKAESVRVLAPVPGKGTVGVEVPNSSPKPVSLREIIESKAWENKKCDIPVVLGKDVTGKPIITDLARMPHCLIAGSTGSGKSVCINGIVASLVYHAGPDDIRFIMVDPKVVELQVYNKLPHMLIPVVTDPKKVPGALKWLISEMERRYQIFAKTGVKNIAGFNAKLTKDRADAEAARQMDLSLSPEERLAAAQAVEVPRDDGVLEIPEKKLPYIVCFIDELADLMMVAPADIETAIARLAQLARAAGIHLILATQRPSVNVITGIIKANLPCRIAFKVTSLIDSRTILDQKGAEALIGRGDMLFIPPGSAHLVRAQGAFVSEEEINDLVDDIAEKNGEPEFDDFVQEEIERAAMEGGDNAPTEGTDDPNEDPMIAKSWEIIRATKRASTSMLQRKLSIGYNRAARIMDILCERGYIGPENGSSPREILKE